MIDENVKSSNILLEKSGRVVLVGFGACAFLDRAPEPDEPQSIMGNPVFMAPEQILGNALDPRSDLYSLGLVLYQISTGKLAREFEGIGDFLRKIQEEEILPLRKARRDLPRGFIRAVMKALERDPGRRYSSAEEMEEALRAQSR